MLSTPPVAIGAVAYQNRLLVVELKPVQTGDGMHENTERRPFQVEKLATILADEMHLGFAAARTRVAVLQFLVFLGSHNLYDTCFFETRKIAVNRAWRNGRQLAYNVGCLENPVRILGDKIHDQLPRLRFVFHVGLCSKCMKFTGIVRVNSICKSFANLKIVKKGMIGNKNSRHCCRESCCSKEECMKKS